MPRGGPEVGRRSHKPETPVQIRAPQHFDAPFASLRACSVQARGAAKCAELVEALRPRSVQATSTTFGTSKNEKLVCIYSSM